MGRVLVHAGLLRQAGRISAFCEGFRMPAAYDGAAGFDLPGLSGCRRDPPVQLFRYGTNVANGRKRLMVENDFGIMCDFKELRVAKIAHIATFALCA